MRGEEMSPEEMAALAREEERAFEDRIVAALERAPDLSSSIPADFAERVAAKLPARRLVAVRTTHYGRKVMWWSLAVLLVMLVLVAVRGAERSTIGAAVEWTLYGQFLAIAIWLAVRRWRAS
ncbi:hypothetical protein [Edaphobacter aggregans]|uniref:hypothetical protein n=1 Tax=Edaphobacter aggregans TaxID=570835 RepID=UPI0005595C05|nr:hypothetical protein [Edaphobacter aggregans]